jgi:lipooligosaccharide transport system ATP-binding protein
VRAGECFGILGPNGAGKTTTIKMLYGFSPMTGGSLTLFGLDITSRWREIRSRIGVCQQENSLDPDLTVLENLLVFARYFDIGKTEALAKAGELLSFIALDHRRNATETELSGGLKRRLMLARALINSPELVILDEPTTGLDPQSRHQFWMRLEDLRKGGMTILLTTHYMEEASRLCDRLIIIDNGAILVEGAPAGLIREHVGAEIIEVAEPTDDLRQFVRDRKLENDDLGHRMIIYGNNGGQLYERISREFSRDGCTLRRATLEDVFLKLTGRDLRE